MLVLQTKEFFCDTELVLHERHLSCHYWKAKDQKTVV